MKDLPLKDKLEFELQIIYFSGDDEMAGISIGALVAIGAAIYIILNNKKK